jgi:hypothetical protein
MAFQSRRRALHEARPSASIGAIIVFTLMTRSAGARSKISVRSLVKQRLQIHANPAPTQYIEAEQIQH